MANQIATLAAPASPSWQLAAAVANFMATGSVAPTVATPAFRTGSASTFQTASAGTTLSIPLSSSIVAGDVILMCVRINTTSQGTNPPVGFTYLANMMDQSAYQTWVYWKVATAGDPGTSVSWTHGLGGVQMAIVTLSYSGVNSVVPGYANGAQVGSGTTFTAPTITTPVASTVVEIFGAYASGVTLTGPTTQRGTINATSGNVAVCVSDQTQGAAGTTGTQTATASVSSSWAALTLVLNGAPSGGSVPPGGWNVVDIWGPVGTGYYVVYQSPGASNNAGSTWYLIMGIGSGSISFRLCELYNVSTHVYNAPTCIQLGQSYAPNAPSSATTPPYAQVFTSPVTVASTYSGEFMQTYTPTVGTNNYIVAANRDGFFLSLLAGGTLSNCAYFGTGTTFVTNPVLTASEVMLFCAQFASGSYVGFTRQPGCAANYQYFGWYSLNPFCVGTAQYTLGTAPTGNGDIFLAPNSQTIAARIVTIPTNNSQWYLTGGVRGLLPAWLQFMYTSGCAYADTMTEGSDSLIYVGTSGNATYFWIDASVA